MTRDEQRRRDRLHAKAEELAAHLFCRVLKAPLDSPDLQRLKRIANKAGKRAERRYQASLERNPAP